MCSIDTEAIYTLSERMRVQLSKELNIDGIVEKAIDQLYDDRKVNKATRNKLHESHYVPLKKAVEEGFGKPLFKIEYGTPNYEFLKQLQTNTAVFAVFKSHASLKDMAALLKDKDGNLRTRADFKKEALKIDATYRGSKLDVEYDTAVRTARAAANWQKYEAKKRLYPNLKYLLTKSTIPDQQHLKLVGIIRPVDDAFWNTHYPPNRWRCQCSVEQTDEGITDIPDKLPAVDPAFAFNAGKLGKVFDIENSDYIKKAEPKEQPALIRDARKIVNKDAAMNAEYQPLYQSKKGGTVNAHPLAFDNADFNDVAAKARAIANKYTDKIKILPDTNDNDLRTALLPAKGVKEGKCPDYFINENTVADLKTVTVNTRKAIHRAVERCYEQCDNLILSVEAKSMSSYFLKRVLKGKLNSGYSKMEKVLINFRGEWHKLTRIAILNGEWF